jgi:hypothetical protein
MYITVSHDSTPQDSLHISQTPPNPITELQLNYVTSAISHNYADQSQFQFFCKTTDFHSVIL